MARLFGLLNCRAPALGHLRQRLGARTARRCAFWENRNGRGERIIYDHHLKSFLQFDDPVPTTKILMIWCSCFRTPRSS